MKYSTISSRAQCTMLHFIYNRALFTMLHFIYNRALCTVLHFIFNRALCTLLLLLTVPTTVYVRCCRSVVNGIMAQVASNLKTAVDVTDLAFRNGSMTKTIDMLKNASCLYHFSLKFFIWLFIIPVDLFEEEEKFSRKFLFFLGS